MNECKSNQSECIPLAPFFHQVNANVFVRHWFLFFLQVGGHSSMFQYDSTTVCKLLDKDELRFYQSMPEILKEFTPEFRGLTTNFFLDFSREFLVFL